MTKGEHVDATIRLAYKAGRDVEVVMVRWRCGDVEVLRC